MLFHQTCTIFTLAVCAISRQVVFGNPGLFSINAFGISDLQHGPVLLNVIISDISSEKTFLNIVPQLLTLNGIKLAAYKSFKAAILEI